MSKVLLNTNVSDLLKISAGDSQALRELIENFENSVKETFKAPEPAKKETDRTEQASSATAGS